MKIDEDAQDRRELAAAKKRNAGKRGTPLRQTTDLFDYVVLLDARRKDSGKRRLSHAKVKKHYR